MKLKSGEIAEIIYHKPGGKIQSSKGLLPEERFDDYIPRRLKSGGIRIWDLGYFLGEDLETYFTNETYLSPEVTHINDAPSGDTNNFSYTITEEEENDIVQGLHDSIFLTELENFRNKYWHIQKGDTPFEKSIKVEFDRTESDHVDSSLDSLTEWKDSGLVLNQDQVESLIIKANDDYFVPLFNLPPYGLNFSDIRVTDVLDYDADPVDFTPSPKMDIFLIPMLVFNAGTSIFRNGQMIGETFNYDRRINESINLNYQVIPREKITDFESIDTTGSTYSFNYALWQIMKVMAHNRGFRGKIEINTVGSTHFIATSEDILAADTPFEDIYTPSGIITPSSHIYSETFSVDFSYINYTVLARLRAVIYKGGSWYYIWHDV